MLNLKVWSEQPPTRETKSPRPAGFETDDDKSDFFSCPVNKVTISCRSHKDDVSAWWWQLAHINPSETEKHASNPLRKKLERKKLGKSKKQSSQNLHTASQWKKVRKKKPRLGGKSLTEADEKTLRVICWKSVVRIGFTLSVWRVGPRKRCRNVTLNVSSVNELCGGGAIFKLLKETAVLDFDPVDLDQKIKKTQIFYILIFS